MPRCPGLDLEEAMDLLEDPAGGRADFIFGFELVAMPDESGPADADRPAGRSGHVKKAAVKRPGTVSAHSAKRSKYGNGSLPDPVKVLMRENWPLLNEMRSEKWSSIFEKLESAALATGTWKKYCSALNLYLEFRKELKLKPVLDLSEKTVLSFIVWAKETRNLSGDTLTAYLSGLKTVAGMLGVKTEHNLPKSVSLCLKGVMHLNERDGKRPKKSAPLTFRILKKLKEKIGIRKWRGSSKKTVWAACCLGYFGAFRAGEMLPKFETEFDKFSDLLWQDVKFVKGGVQIKIKAPKTGTKGGETVDLFAFPEKRWCPIAALKGLKKVQKSLGIWSENLPVFRFGSGKNLTVSGLSQFLSKLLKHTRFRHLAITARSIRSGFPTDMESFPDLMHDGHVKCWGRWRSRSYQIYMKNDRAQKQWIFGKICEALL
jgi:hypothetical protein